MDCNSRVYYNYAMIREALRYRYLRGEQVDINGNLIDAGENETINGRMLYQMYGVGETNLIFAHGVCVVIPEDMELIDGQYHYPKNYVARNGSFVEFKDQFSHKSVLIEVTDAAYPGALFDDAIICAEAVAMEDYNRFLIYYQSYMDSEVRRVKSQAAEVPRRSVSNESVCLSLVN